MTLPKIGYYTTLLVKVEVGDVNRLGVATSSTATPASKKVVHKYLMPKSKPEEFEAIRRVM